MSFLLFIGGTLAGAVNFFSNFLNLPFGKPKELLNDGSSGEEPSNKTWWVVLIGYIIIGIAGAFLTYVINALIGLKGLELPANAKPNDIYYFVLLGYGIIFGYSTTRLLVSIMDAIIKKISNLDSQIKKLNMENPKEINNSKNLFVPQSSGMANAIIAECKSQFEANKDDCNKFAKAVSSKFDVTLTGQADDIVDQIQGAGWEKCDDSIDANAKAKNGLLVIGGLKAADTVPSDPLKPVTHGHVVVVVAGELDTTHKKYPHAYWGSIDKVYPEPGKDTINYAWNKASRDKVIYRARVVNFHKI